MALYVEVRNVPVELLDVQGSAVARTSTSLIKAEAESDFLAHFCCPLQYFPLRFGSPGVRLRSVFGLK